MSTENVELVKRVLEQSRSDPTALWKILDDDDDVRKVGTLLRTANQRGCGRAGREHRRRR
jgi:hypothetical protein